MARGRLRDRHQENLKKKLELLKAEQGVEENEPAETAVKSEPGDDAENKSDDEKQKEDQE